MSNYMHSYKKNLLIGSGCSIARFRVTCVGYSVVRWLVVCYCLSNRGKGGIIIIPSSYRYKKVILVGWPALIGFGVCVGVCDQCVCFLLTVQYCVAGPFGLNCGCCVCVSVLRCVFKLCILM